VRSALFARPWPGPTASRPLPPSSADYYNPETQVTSWTRPSAEAMRASMRMPETRPATAPATGGGGGKKNSIREYTTKEGRRYQHDSETGETVWLDPKPASREQSAVGAPSASESPASSPRAPAPAPAATGDAAAASSSDGGAVASGAPSPTREPKREITDGGQVQDALLQLQRLAHSGVGGSDAAVAQAEKLQSLKKEMLQAAKLTHKLQSELQELEKLISLHIHNRMEVQDKLSAKKGLQQIDGSKGGSGATPRTKMTARDRKRYETLLYLLRVNPSWLAALIGQVTHDMQPQLVQFVIFVLYADMHDPEDDLLLLQVRSPLPRALSGGVTPSLTVVYPLPPRCRSSLARRCSRRWRSRTTSRRSCGTTRRSRSSSPSARAASLDTRTRPPSLARSLAPRPSLAPCTLAHPHNVPLGAPRHDTPCSRQISLIVLTSSSSSRQVQPARARAGGADGDPLEADRGAAGGGRVALARDRAAQGAQGAVRQAGRRRAARGDERRRGERDPRREGRARRARRRDDEAGDYAPARLSSLI